MALFRFSITRPNITVINLISKSHGHPALLLCISGPSQFPCPLWCIKQIGVLVNDHLFPIQLRNCQFVFDSSFDYRYFCVKIRCIKVISISCNYICIDHNESLYSWTTAIGYVMICNWVNTVYFLGISSHNLQNLFDGMLQMDDGRAFIHGWHIYYEA